MECKSTGENVISFQAKETWKYNKLFSHLVRP